MIRHRVDTHFSWLTFSCGALALCHAACASPPGGEAIGRSASPIIGGAVDSGDPAVVLLVSYPPDESTFDTCTASVIAATVLLTAAHCIDATDHPNFRFGVFLGADASAYATAAELAPKLVDASKVVPDPDYKPTKHDFPADVGVVILASPLSIAPLPINVMPLDASLAGTSARIIGYGETVYEQFNTAKYAATTSVVGLDPDGHTVIVGDATHHDCVGDSGGPAIVAMSGVPTIVGVDSFTSTDGCTDPSNFQRTDIYQDFLSTYLPTSPTGSGGSGGSAEGGGTGESSSHASSGASGGSTGSKTSTGAGSKGEGGSGGGTGTPSSGGCTAAPKQLEFGFFSTFGIALALTAAGSLRRRRS